MVKEASTGTHLKRVLIEISRRPNSALQVFILILATVTLCIVNMAFGDTIATRPNVDAFKENQIKLYDALRQFALPDLSYDSNSQQRFILQVPGKVLNPFDFYPGKKYIDYCNNPENYTEKVDIPQHMMERVFYLVDVIPGAHPVTGETTGYSLARLYESILDNLDQVGFDDLSEHERKLYSEASDKLVELVHDPDDMSQVSRFQLYIKLQKAYHDEQQKVERTVREKRMQLDAENYKVWIERNYNLLDAQVETVYKRWLLYGQKHLTESYLARLDVVSAEKSLEKARLALRLSGFMSQDLSRKVYPVSLSPSNWFRHLNTR